MRIKTKLTLNSLLVFSLVLITSILVLFLQNKIMEKTKHTLYESCYTSISLVLNADRDFYQALDAFRKYQVNRSSDSLNDYTDNIGQVKDRTKSAIDTLSLYKKSWESILYPDSKENVFSIYASFENNMKIWEKNIANNVIDEDAFEKTRENLNKIGELVDIGAEQAIKSISVMKKTNTIFELSLFAVIILLTTTSGMLISRYINKSISKINSVITECETGNIEATIGIKSKDELGDISVKFDSFITKIKTIIKDIQKLSNEVVNSNSILLKSTDILVNGSLSKHFDEREDETREGIIQLNESIENVLDNVRNQTASSEESLAALEEISSTSSVISENIQTTKISFSETMKKADASSKNIAEMSDSMHEINDSVNNTNKEIETLKNISENIGTIITAINSIADQTNLLALNAAIEAARAGEAGRGFSVVADEIRKLAEQTNKETGKIEELIQGVQTGVNKVRKGSESVLTKVGEGIKLTEISKEDIQDIAKAANKNHSDIENISTSVNEQSIASGEITTAISTITDSSTEIESLSIKTTEISNEIKSSLLNNQMLVNNLNKLANDLKRDLDFFKI